VSSPEDFELIEKEAQAFRRTARYVVVSWTVSLAAMLLWIVGS
jgi:hypothetical protein